MFGLFSDVLGCLNIKLFFGISSDSFEIINIFINNRCRKE